MTYLDKNGTEIDELLIIKNFIKRKNKEYKHDDSVMLELIESENTIDIHIDNTMGDWRWGCKLKESLKVPQKPLHPIKKSKSRFDCDECRYDHKCDDYVQSRCQIDLKSGEHYAK